MTVDHFYGCHMTISYGTNVDTERSHHSCIFWHSLNLWFLTEDNFEILKFWNVFQRAFPHCFLCVQYTSLRKKTFSLFFITWKEDEDEDEDVTNVNARVCSLVYYLYALFGKNTMATGNMDNYERSLAGIDVKY